MEGEFLAFSGLEKLSRQDSVDNPIWLFYFHFYPAAISVSKIEFLLLGLRRHKIRISRLRKNEIVLINPVQSGFYDFRIKRHGFNIRNNSI